MRVTWICDSGKPVDEKSKHQHSESAFQIPATTFQAFSHIIKVRDREVIKSECWRTDSRGSHLQEYVAKSR